MSHGWCLVERCCYWLLWLLLAVVVIVVAVVRSRYSLSYNSFLHSTTRSAGGIGGGEKESEFTKAKEGMTENEDINVGETGLWSKLRKY